MMRAGLSRLAGLVMMLATVVSAAERPLTMSVFVPSAVAEGQTRFALGEALAADLSKSLGRPVRARNFGRFEDFSRSVQGSNSADLVLVDAWIAAETALPWRAVAGASTTAELNTRWVVVGRTGTSLMALRGKKLAVIRGTGTADAKFLSSVVFGGDLDVRKHFRLVPVPSVEAAAKIFEARGVDAALVPAERVPAGAKVLYRSAPSPQMVFAVVHGDVEAMKSAVLGLTPPEPLAKIGPLSAGSLEELHATINKGPPKRQCVMAESPVQRIDGAALFSYDEAGRALPRFVDFMAKTNQQPDN